jgi:hypothetical protein
LNAKCWPKPESGDGSVWRNVCNKSPRSTAKFFPLKQRRKRRVTLRSELGDVSLLVDYGQEPETGRWYAPLQAAWGLGPHEKMTPAFAEKLCFTVTATGSYEEAAQVASKWSLSVDDSTLHALTQRVGARAEQQAQARYQEAPKERLPGEPASALGVLMVDGCQIRYRGEGWGKKKSKKEHVEWHELKMGVFYRHEQWARTEKGRGLLTGKVVVSCQNEAAELGRQLHWEARREGLGRAKEMLFLGDGAAWVWNLKKDRWSQARGLLDFYHASEHVWELGRAVQGEKESALGAWVEPMLHRLRHGKEKQVLEQMAGLRKRQGEAGEIIQREQNYFVTHAERINYQEIADQGWPIGSGAVESACRQKQCRFKRCGQFWTKNGLRNLNALHAARHNRHWDELWQN